MSDYKELVKALRSRSTLCESIDCYACEAIHFVCTDKILHDAAAAIETLEGLLETYRFKVRCLEPKRGEWEQVGDNAYKCTNCGEISCCKGKYCPDCGAKMEVQDGKD